MSKNEYKSYEVWHDECKKDGYFHGILLIPIDKKQQIIGLLRKIRKEHKYYDNDIIKFSGCLKKPEVGKYVSNNLSLFSHIIQTNSKEKTKLFNRTGRDVYEKRFDPFLEITGSFGCRFGLLKIKNLENTLDYFKNYRKKVETSLRFVIKGCCHGMFDEKTPIKFVKLYFDGNDHYKGDLDISRLIKGDWRSYCKVNNNLPIDDRGMKQRNDETKLMMNFVDNIVGAWNAILNQAKDPNKVLFPLKDIYSRLLKNLIFINKNSSWYKSISFSEFSIVDGEIMFKNLFRNDNQIELFK